MARAKNITNFSENDGWKEAVDKLNNNFRQILLLLGDAGSGVSLNTDVVTSTVDYDTVITEVIKRITNPLFNQSYPVGSVILTMTTTDSRLKLGTWERIASGKVLLGSSSDFPAGSTGGSSEVKQHNHTLSLSPSEGEGISLVSGGYVAGETASLTLTTDDTGSDNSSDILPPYLSVLVYKRTA